MSSWFALPKECPIVSGDPAAEPVLGVLHVDADAHVRNLAELGLNRIAAKRKEGA
jgi:hypothetical protein